MGMETDGAYLGALNMLLFYFSQIPGFPNYYLMQKTDHPVVSIRDGSHHTRSLEEDARVKMDLFKKYVTKRWVGFELDLMKIWK